MRNTTPMTPTSKSSGAGQHAESQTSLDGARKRLIVVWTWVGALLLGAVVLYIANILSIAIGIIIWTAVFAAQFVLGMILLVQFFRKIDTTDLLEQVTSHILKQIDDIILLYK